jgi:hypothetical protein
MKSEWYKSTLSPKKQPTPVQNSTIIVFSWQLIVRYLVEASTYWVEVCTKPVSAVFHVVHISVIIFLSGRYH